MGTSSGLAKPHPATDNVSLVPVLTATIFQTYQAGANYGSKIVTADIPPDARQGRANALTGFIAHVFARVLHTQKGRAAGARAPALGGGVSSICDALVYQILGGEASAPDVLAELIWVGGEGDCRRGRGEGDSCRRGRGKGAGRSGAETIPSNEHRLDVVAELVAPEAESKLVLAAVDRVEVSLIAEALFFARPVYHGRAGIARAEIGVAGRECCHVRACLATWAEGGHGHGRGRQNVHQGEIAIHPLARSVWMLLESKGSQERGTLAQKTISKYFCMKTAYAVAGCVIIAAEGPLNGAARCGWRNQPTIEKPPR
jgi:hypothetical protein